MLRSATPLLMRLCRGREEQRPIDPPTSRRPTLPTPGCCDGVGPAWASAKSASWRPPQACRGGKRIDNVRCFPRNAACHGRLGGRVFAPSVFPITWSSQCGSSDPLRRARPPKLCRCGFLGRTRRIWRLQPSLGPSSADSGRCLPKLGKTHLTWPERRRTQAAVFFRALREPFRPNAQTLYRSNNLALRRPVGFRRIHMWPATRVAFAANVQLPPSRGTDSALRVIVLVQLDH